MKKGLLIVTALVLLVLVIGFSTNPSYAEYKEWYKLQVYKDMEDKTEMERSIYGFFADMISDVAIVRKDYKVCSLYTINEDNYSLKVIGLFNNFYVLEDKNNQDN